MHQLSYLMNLLGVLEEHVLYRYTHAKGQTLTGNIMNEVHGFQKIIVGPLKLVVSNMFLT